MPTLPQEVAILVGLEVISQSSYGEKTAPHTAARLMLVGADPGACAFVLTTDGGLEDDNASCTISW
ncbi:hypothetical protein ELQ35_07205 [Peribacillus cavernae]|uniref:Uncharacterized protein n=1 Tax=Peribacillus cavernae TaxID=1674310 RepID=A0A433HPB3_9BACI|nr:hypothetical protein [Peribacillus cavernae]MDQ0217423.1 hypothetical protein [Peribacillus cavernae]RUQ30129.1 hypothetical protein ELQ35_07205 [Peribacillus cavernae]